MHLWGEGPSQVVRAELNLEKYSYSRGPEWSSGCFRPSVFGKECEYSRLGQVAKGVYMIRDDVCIELWGEVSPSSSLV